ncbi:MAG: class I SAM-dependent methyltransferase [Gammaproteobacteria bacterium]|nr:class I SAM-dependent methyltransferase [Gammaproteobacteria bacterium]
MNDFYDDLAQSYHLIFEDWDTSIIRQGDALSGVILERWGGDICTVLDVACGIGTQAIALANLGFEVTASDLSGAAVKRAGREAQARNVDIAFSVCNMLHCHDHHQREFDLEIACDNSIPHLLSDNEILTALRQMYDCVRPGGGILLTVRDYDTEPRGNGILKPYGLREVDGKRMVLFQVWDFEGDLYDLSLHITEDDGKTDVTTTRIMRTRYYAISSRKLMALMQEAGFVDIERNNNAFYQPVLTGMKDMR